MFYITHIQSTAIFNYQQSDPRAGSANDEEFFMKYAAVILLGFTLLFSAVVLSACQRENTVCLPDNGTPEPRPDLAELIAMPPDDSPASPVEVSIAGKIMTVDKVVNGPLCNDTWSGTVYVGCDVIVAGWQADEGPLFLKGCNLQIEPGTVVYVADHNDAAYYKGCSCHTGEGPGE